MSQTLIAQAEAAIQKILSGAVASALETVTLDFKEFRGSKKDAERVIADAAICFANSAGGIVAISVADNLGGTQAFGNCPLKAEEIKQRVYEMTRPHLSVDVINSIHVSHCMLIVVPQSSEIHADTKGRATRRINTDCLPLMPDEIRKIREEKQGYDWSAENSGSKIDEVRPTAIEAARIYLRRFNDERRQLADASGEDILRACGAITRDGYLTRGGALMFGAPLEFNDAFVYQYRMTPGGEPRAVLRLSPPFIMSFSRLMDAVETRQTSTPLSLPTGQQITLSDFPELAVREAVANAICHRDYTLNGPVFIDHSPEVFSVTSPGPLVSGVTPSNIITTTSRPRNPNLAKIARTLGIAEELGRGVDRIYRELIRSGRPVPEFKDTNSAIVVTFVGGASDTQVARFIAGLSDNERDDTDTMLAIYWLCSHKTVSAPTLSSWLQKSEREAEVVLRRLTNEPNIIIEPTRSTIRRAFPNYRLRGPALKELGYAVSYQRRTTDEIDRKLLAHLHEYKKITNRTIQNILDVDVYRARNIIKDMASRGIVVRVSEQARGPKVEWGAGPELPPAAQDRRVKRRSTVLTEYHDDLFSGNARHGNLINDRSKD